MVDSWPAVRLLFLFYNDHDRNHCHNSDSSHNDDPGVVGCGFGCAGIAGRSLGGISGRIGGCRLIGVALGQGQLGRSGNHSLDLSCGFNRSCGAIHIEHFGQGGIGVIGIVLDTEASREITAGDLNVDRLGTVAGERCRLPG